MHIARLGWLAAAALSLSAAGCSLQDVLHVPGSVALGADFARIDFLREDATSCFPTFQALDAAVKSGLEPVIPEYAEPLPPPPPGFDRSKGAVAQFLHVSDVHIRDADIPRKSGMEKSLGEIDRVVGTAARLAHTEAFDSLVFAAFLSGYAKAHATPAPAGGTATPAAGGPPAFIMHGGDLVDISLITELTEGLRILRGAAQAHPSVPIYTMVGNHDGLFLGNWFASLTDTLGLVVNGPEFVLGHLLADPKDNRGFGFGWNEVLERFGEDSVPPVGHPAAHGFEDRLKALERTDEGKRFARQIRQMAWAARKRAALRGQADVDVEWLLGCPAVVHHAIYTTAKTLEDDLVCGYYSWTVPTRISVPGKADAPLTFRFIVLDTLGRLYQAGNVDDIQLGWLYKELVKARNGKECVLIFAHHHPEKMAPWCQNRKHFLTLLRAFPNIAGYFYGHSHENAESWPESYPQKWGAFSNRPVAATEDAPRTSPYAHGLGRFALIQTAATADFPQTAREVEVFAKKAEQGDAVTIGFRWRHVRPAGSDNSRDGAILNAALHASRRDAREEYNKRSWDRPSTWEKVESVPDWDLRRLHGGCGTVTIEFTEDPGFPDSFGGKLKEPEAKIEKAKAQFKETKAKLEEAKAKIKAIKHKRDALGLPTEEP